MNWIRLFKATAIVLSSLVAIVLTTLTIIATDSMFAVMLLFAWVVFLVYNIID